MATGCCITTLCYIVCSLRGCYTSCRKVTTCATVCVSVNMCAACAHAHCDSSRSVTHCHTFFRGRFWTRRTVAAESVFTQHNQLTRIAVRHTHTRRQADKTATHAGKHTHVLSVCVFVFVMRVSRAWG